ncbi:MAG: hypothetical protein ACM37W_20925 [Actinomycetota bacterium]
MRQESAVTDEVLTRLIDDYKNGHLNEQTLSKAINNCAKTNAAIAVNQTKEWLIVFGVGLLLVAQTPPAQQVIQQGATTVQQAVGNLTGQPVNTNLDAGKIVSLVRSKGYAVRTAPGAVNIIYLQHPDLLGTMNQWSDRRLIIQFDGATPKITHDGAATTKPGLPTFRSPKNPAGAPVILPGQYKAWQVGIHYGSGANPHEGLIQVAPVLLARSLDGGKTFKPARWELTGINNHWGYNMDSVRNASEGCLVEQSKQGHIQFMRLVKSDPDYIRNPSYLFSVTVLNWGELNQ